MAGVHELLRSAGIPVEPPAGVRVALTRVAEALARRGCATLGLVPAADDVGVPSVAIQAALAIAELSGAPVAVVDPTGTWFALGASPEARGPVAALITERVALVAAQRREGTVGPGLAALLRADPRTPARLVVDLTGLEQTGEHAEAYSFLDGVAVVARAGRTSVHEIERLLRSIPEEKSLGVVLVGG